jgi:D-alanyl-D-alanine carboxypeptidase
MRARFVSAAAVVLITGAATSGVAQATTGDAVQVALHNAVLSGAPGAVAVVRDSRGHTAGFVDGKANVETGTAPRVGDRFRVGSVTKSFVATVVLQLEAEHRLSLDDSLQRWLPGVVPDAAAITLRELLQHTGGIPDYVAHLPHDVDSRLVSHTPAELLALIKNDPPTFRPGTGWSYSNTDYLLAGMLIRTVTGSDWRTEVQRRILGPLHLSATSTPGAAITIAGPHLHGYQPDQAALVDVTRMSATQADSAGEIISNAGDLSRFFSALLSGKLVPRKQLDEMTTAVAVPELNGGYGLGLMRTDLRCGISVWGHGGMINGFNTWAASTADGSRAIGADTNQLLPDSTGSYFEVLNAAFC